MTNAPLPAQAAAEWLAALASPPHPLIPELKARFGLTAKQACEAIAQARQTPPTGTEENGGSRS
ncbi:hypothetical protein ACLE20_06965 [Rhizobium sp. YIM 134829]|uniref:hypothetical protein n=1 Tax=Rhizobium sp. YIM 134829 TaxID=3390453 RepID=UPI00397E8A84